MTPNTESVQVVQAVQAVEELTRAIGTDVQQFIPGVIVVTDATNVRPWISDEDETRENERIKSLAASIARDGQLQPGVVRTVETGEGTEYHLVAGARRLKAIKLHNEKNPKHQLRYNAVVMPEMTENDAYRKAMMENLQRQDMSPMDMALNITDIRRRFNWDTVDCKDWSKKVADFLGKSRAYVTQKAKLIEEVDAETQKLVHEGKLSEDAALASLKVKAEFRADTMDKAKELAAESAGIKLDESGNPEPNADGTIPALKVTGEHIDTAARTIPDAVSVPTVLSRKELLEMLEQFDSDVYGHKNGATRQFVTYFVDKFAKGIGTPSRVTKLFDALTSGNDRGSESPSDAKDRVEAVSAAAAVKVAKAVKSAKTEVAKAVKGKKAA